MKFLYEYRTSDNVKHSGEIYAADREAAYAELKKKGVKPSRFAEAPGFFNKLFGKGKRWVAIVVLAGLAAVLAVKVLNGDGDTGELIDTLEATVRRQIIGDTAIIEKGIRTGWSEVFSLEGDRFLASFAIPGVSPSVRNTTEENLRKALDTDELAVETKADALEAKQVRAIVSGMKKEIRELLGKGWTLKEVGIALVQRQEREISYYERAKNEVDSAKNSGMSENALIDLWEKRNNSLRRIGIRLIPLPEKNEN